MKINKIVSIFGTLKPWNFSTFHLGYFQSESLSTGVSQSVLCGGGFIWDKSNLLRKSEVWFCIRTMTCSFYRSAHFLFSKPAWKVRQTGENLWRFSCGNFVNKRHEYRSLISVCACFKDCYSSVFIIFG